MKQFWLVAADGGRVRFFRGEGPQAHLEEVESFVNTAGTRNERDLVSDRPGRSASANSFGSGAVNETHHKEHSVDEFGRRIAEFLDRQLEAGELQTVSVVAAPAMLGHVRAHLSKSVQALVLEEVAKDVTTEAASAIQARLTRLQL
jgi:protein required for attachment to host cells